MVQGRSFSSEVGFQPAEGVSLGLDEMFGVSRTAVE